MEKSIQKTNPLETKPGEKSSHEVPVKIGIRHYEMLQEDRAEINGDPRFKKKISIRRYVEKLIESYRKECVEDLKKERERSEDWVKIQYEKKAPGVEFWDWVKGLAEKEMGLKVPKRPLAMDRRKSEPVKSAKGEGA